MVEYCPRSAGTCSLTSLSSPVRRTHARHLAAPCGSQGQRSLAPSVETATYSRESPTAVKSWRVYHSAPVATTHPPNWLQADSVRLFATLGAPDNSIAPIYWRPALYISTRCLLRCVQCSKRQPYARSQPRAYAIHYHLHHEKLAALTARNEGDHGDKTTSGDSASVSSIHGTTRSDAPAQRSTRRN